MKNLTAAGMKTSNFAHGAHFQDEQNEQAWIFPIFMTKISIMKIALLLTISTLLAFVSCSKSSTPPSTQNEISRASDPNRSVFVANIDVSKEFKTKIKKTDVMIWDLKDETGVLVAGGVITVPTFPYEITVRAKQLLHPIKNDAHLLFTARVVKQGDEYAPPKKGQLQGWIGYLGESKVESVAPRQIDPEKLKKIQKKLAISTPEDISVGGKATVLLQPTIF